MYPELVGIADNFIEGTEINVEELLKLDPDVVIYWAEYENQYEALQSVGIPAVGVKGAEGGDVIATLSTWLDIMGQMFGTTGNTEGVIEYANTVKQEVADKLADATEEEKPKVLYLYNHSKEQISACGSTFTAATGSSRLVASMSVQSWIPLQMSIWSRSMSGIRISLS